jgi:hypothetical protein
MAGHGNHDPNQEMATTREQSLDGLKESKPTVVYCLLVNFGNLIDCAEYLCCMDGLGVTLYLNSPDAFVMLMGSAADFVLIEDDGIEL